MKIHLLINTQEVCVALDNVRMIQACLLVQVIRDALEGLVFLSALANRLHQAALAVLPLSLRVVLAILSVPALQAGLGTNSDYSSSTHYAYTQTMTRHCHLRVLTKSLVKQFNLKSMIPFKSLLITPHEAIKF